MNIFYLDPNFIRCAQAHTDRHVVKMITEYNQLLCTALHVWLDQNPEAPASYRQSVPYKRTHQNHPCARWVQQGPDNWLWLFQLNTHLCAEYTHRYGRIHAGQVVLEKLGAMQDPGVDWGWSGFLSLGETLPRAMPEEFHRPTVLESYREYIRTGKAHLHSWKNRARPDWL